MKTFIKITAVVMALLLCGVIFASCGGGGSTESGSADGGDTPAASASGKTETWGNITVLVPDGMTLKGGNILDENDPDVVNISKDDNAMNYFLITIKDVEDDVVSGIDSTREMNEGCEDVTIDAGASWTGVGYDYSGTPVLQVYAEVDGRFAIVQSYGFAKDDDITKSVLSSLKVTSSEG